MATRRSPRWAAVSAILLAAACGGSELGVGGGAPEPVACTEIGCASGVSLVAAEGAALPLATAAEVCLDDICSSQPVTVLGDQALIGIDADLLAGKERVESLTIKLTNAGATTFEGSADGVAVRRSEPNGPECPPICYQLDLALGTDGHLRPA